MPIEWINGEILTRFEMRICKRNVSTPRDAPTNFRLRQTTPFFRSVSNTCRPVSSRPLSTIAGRMPAARRCFRAAPATPFAFFDPYASFILPRLFKLDARLFSNGGGPVGLEDLMTRQPADITASTKWQVQCASDRWPMPRCLSNDRFARTQG